MSSTALQIAADAYQDAGLDQTLTSFSMTERPYNCALDLINTAIGDMNRAGSYQFGETSQVLPFSSGIYSYDLNTVSSSIIEPRRIKFIRREMLNFQGQIKQYNWKDFLYLYRRGAISTQTPYAWSKYSNTLYLSTIPDQDYTITLYYYQQIQPIIVGTNDNTITIIPEYHEDVLRDLLKSYLFKEMGRPDFQEQYQLAMLKVKELVARSQEDSGLPAQLPRMF